MIEHQYSHDFYDYIDAGSRRSARTVAGLLLPEMKIASLLDVGAGHGAWAAEWLAAGVKEVVAVDGDYVARASSRSATNFIAHDLATRSTSSASSTWSDARSGRASAPCQSRQFVDNLIATATSSCSRPRSARAASIMSRAAA